MLVVSPDVLDHSSLEMILETGYRVYSASGRQEAFALMRRNRPDVVICEHTLPDGDWRDILSDLQGEHEAPRLIVSSRLADTRLWAEVLNLGGYDLLMKPFAAREVRSVVAMAVRRAKAVAGR